MTFRSNSNNTSYKLILGNCSRELTISTVGIYKKLLPPLNIELDKIKTIMIADKCFPDKSYYQMKKQITKWTNNLNNICVVTTNSTVVN